MEEDLLSDAPGYKLYKERSIQVATYIGGPLTAGYLIAHNFKQLGEHQKANRTWIIAILATIVIFGTIFLIPDSVKIPPFVIPFIYASIIAYLTKQYQSAYISSHMQEGGQLYSTWRAVLVGVIGLVLMFAIIILALVVSGVDLT